MARCDICSKSTAYGRNIRHKHSGRWERKAPRTNRTFKANVQRKTFIIDGTPLRLKICTRCIRNTTKNERATVK
jgi:large subunit ribosomal protein L28